MQRSAGWWENLHKLRRDLTQKYKKELVQVLKGLKEEEKISDRQHKQLYPTTENAPRVYGVPKTHKPNVPLRQIVIHL